MRVIKYLVKKISELIRPSAESAEDYFRIEFPNDYKRRHENDRKHGFPRVF